MYLLKRILGYTKNIMEYQAIITKEVGRIYGRDAIFLDSFHQEFNECIFKGEFNSNLVEVHFNQHFVPYTFHFLEVIYYQCCELDLYFEKTNSSFDLVHDSQLLAKLRSKSSSEKIKPDHQHYVLKTYDDVYNIIARNYKLVVA